MQSHHKRIFDRATARQIRERHAGARIDLIRKREDMELSRPALAAKIGVCRHFIFAVETGKRNPSLEIMERWSRELGGAPFDIFAQQAA